MLNLDNLTINFIELNYLDVEKPLIYDAFGLLESFGVQYYEDRYIQMIAQSDEMHKEDMLTSFNGFLCEDLGKIVREHYITLNTGDIRLKECAELVRFLWIIQSMENYENVGYRLYAQDSPRNIIVDMVCELVPLSKPRVMELIDSVDAGIVGSIKRLVEDKIEASYPSHTTDPVVAKFVKYIGETPALGNKLINTSTTNVELKDLSLVLDLELPVYIDKLMLTDKVKAALDVMSLLLVCTDGRLDPVGVFKARPEVFSDSTETITALTPLLTRMYQDFRDYADHMPA